MAMPHNESCGALRKFCALTLLRFLAIRKYCFKTAPRQYAKFTRKSLLSNYAVLPYMCNYLYHHITEKAKTQERDRRCSVTSTREVQTPSTDEKHIVTVTAAGWGHPALRRGGEQYKSRGTRPRFFEFAKQIPSNTCAAHEKGTPRRAFRVPLGRRAPKGRSSAQTCLRHGGRTGLPQQAA